MKNYIKPELEMMELEAHEALMVASKVNNAPSDAQQLAGERIMDGVVDSDGSLLGDTPLW